MDNNKLYRPSDDKIIAGVCSGIANFFGLEKSHIRAAALILAIVGGFSVLAYLVLWIIMPSR